MTDASARPEDEGRPRTAEDLRPDVSDDRMPTWESQAAQYPPHGQPGISYYRGQVTADFHVDCLLCRDENGALVGILNHYPDDFPPYENQGNVNIWVHPGRRRQGIGTDLLEESYKRWKPPENAKISETGVEWLKGLEKKYSGSERDFRDEGWEEWHSRLIREGEVSEPHDPPVAPDP